MVKQNPPPDISDYRLLWSYFIDHDLGELFEHFFSLYGQSAVGPRASHIHRRVVYMLHISIMRHNQGAELIPHLSLLAYLRSAECLDLLHRLGGAVSLPTVLSRIENILRNRPAEVARRLAAHIERSEAIIFIMDDFQRTMRSSVGIRRMMAERDSNFSNATKIFSSGRPGTNCRVSIAHDIPLLQFDFRANLRRIQQHVTRVDLRTWICPLNLAANSERYAGARSTRNFRLLNLNAAPLKSFEDIVSALLELDDSLDDAMNLVTNGAPRPPLFLCGDFPLFKTYAQLGQLLPPLTPWPELRAALNDMIPGATLRNDALHKLERMHRFMSVVIPLPAQFHAQQSALKGLYCSGFRVLFRPVAQAVSGKCSLTADLPFNVVERQFRIIQQASSSLSWLNGTEEISDEPWVFMVRHFVKELMPLAMDMQDMFRAAPMVALERYVARMILLFAELGKQHYRSCFVYLATQLSHFKDQQNSVHSYLDRKFADLNEVAVEYYHARLCSFTNPGMVPKDVALRAMVIDEARELVADVDQFLDLSGGLKYRARAKFSPTDAVVLSDVAKVCEFYDDALLAVRQCVEPVGCRMFLSEVVLSQQGELFYRSPTFGLVECRLLGMRYSPHCVLSCTICLSRRAVETASCGAPVCEHCEHACDDSCEIGWKPLYAEMLHTCAICAAAISRSAVQAALRGAGGGDVSVGSDCAHMVCTICAAVNTREDPLACACCRRLVDDCLVDATDRATQLFSAAPGSSFRRTIVAFLASPVAEDAAASSSSLFPPDAQPAEFTPRVDCSFSAAVEPRQGDLSAMCLSTTPNSSYSEEIRDESSSNPILDMMNLGATALRKYKSMRSSAYPPVDHPGDLIRTWYKKK